MIFKLFLVMRYQKRVSKSVQCSRTIPSSNYNILIFKKSEFKDKITMQELL